MMRRLFLHVGTHKTGTTSFQSCIYEQRAQLAAGGTQVYLETEATPAGVNCVALAHSVLRPGLMTPSRRAGYVKTQRLFGRALQVARLKRFLGTDTAERFLVSAEAFCFARTQEERTAIARLFAVDGVEVVPVICLRDEEGWRASWTRHLDRWEPKFTRPAGEGADNVGNDWYFDRDAIVAFWSGFGEPRIVDYDAAMARDGTIIPALFDVIGISPEVDMARYFLNKS